MPRQGRLPLDGQPLTRSLNHTTFALLRVRADGGRAVAVRATGAARGSTPAWPWSGASAANATGTPSPASTTAAAAASSTSASATRGRFSRITAVVVNADAAANGFSARRLDWRYLTDRIPFEVRGRLIR